MRSRWRCRPRAGSRSRRWSFLARPGLPSACLATSASIEAASKAWKASRWRSCRPPRLQAKSAQGTVDLGVTGEDLLRENAVPTGRPAAEIVARLGFGHANVVVAVPRHLARRRYHGRSRRCRRRFPPAPWPAAAHRHEILAADPAILFAQTRHPGLSHRRKPRRHRRRAGRRSADVIVDITTTGSTLRANHLKVLTTASSCARRPALSRRGRSVRPTRPPCATLPRSWRRWSDSGGASLPLRDPEGRVPAKRGAWASVQAAHCRTDLTGPSRLRRLSMLPQG